MKRIAVLGGGISGLAAAWNLARKGLASMGGHGQLEVALFEASNRVGGWIRSEHSKEGAVFELGPRSLRTAGIAGKTSLEVVWIYVYEACCQARRINYLQTRNSLMKSGPDWHPSLHVAVQIVVVSHTLKKNPNLHASVAYMIKPYSPACLVVIFTMA